MKFFKATALIAVFLVENAFSFAENSTECQVQAQFRLQDVPRPDLYNDSEGNLDETVPGLLAGSSLIYGYAKIRNLVYEHDRNIRTIRNMPYPAKGGGFFGFNKKDKPLVNFNTTALVVTDEGSQDERGRYLKYDISAQAILSFLEQNRKLLKDGEDGIEVDESEVDHPPLAFEKQLTNLIDMHIDARITEFDDQFSGKELVYGITTDM
jgi:hypothetical protein